MDVSGQLHTPVTLPLGMCLQQPLHGRSMRDQHSWSGCFGEQRYLLFLLQIEPWLLSCPACSLITTLTTVSQLIMHCHATFIWLSKDSERRESFGNKYHKVCHYWTVCIPVVINKASTRSLRKYSISACS